MLPNLGVKNMKNRNIEKDEINKITEKCKPREKAFFTVMRQSGLPPHIIKQLKIKNVEKILEQNTQTPCKINAPRERFPTFIGQEAINYLKQYLATRPDKLTPESLLFTNHNNPNKEINTKDVSRTFRLVTQELKKERKITYEIRKRKPSELRLYSLIKFYRKNAKNYLMELDNNHTPKDDEFYRKLYEEKAMPFLEVETPIEIQQLKNENKELKNRLTRIENIILPKENEFEEPSPEYWEHDEKLIEEHEKWIKEHPEKLKKQQEHDEEFEKEYEKRLEEHQDGEEEIYREHLETELDKLRSQIKELQDTIKQTEKIQQRKQ